MKLKNKSLFVFIVITFLLSLVISAATEEFKTILFTNTNQAPPYSFTDKAGKAQGILVDYWNLWAKKNNINIKFKLISDWQYTLNLTKNSDTCVHSFLLPLPSREKYLDFTTPIMREKSYLFIPSILNIKFIQELKNVKIIVNKNGSNEAFLKNNYPELNLISINGIEKIFKYIIKHNDICGFALEYPVAVYYMSKYNILGKFKTFKKLYETEVVAAVKKGNTELLNLVNNGISKITEEEIRHIQENWGKTNNKSIPAWLIKTIIISIIVLVIGFILFYIITLKKKVKEKTSELRKHKEHLDELVDKKTKELSRTNKKLNLKVKQLETTENELNKKTAALKQKNLSLKDILEQLESEKLSLKRNIMANTEKFIFPLIEKLKFKVPLEEKQLINLLEENFKDLASSTGIKLDNIENKLTMRELEICNMIKKGLSSKEIADTLNLSLRTIENHRNNIRKKLDITNKDVNLTTYLQKK